MRNFINIISKPKVKYSIILIILLSIYIFISAISYVEAVSKEIQGSVFRLHVIANSNEEEDQNLKYIVRDKLIEYMNDLSKDANSKEEIIQLANDKKDDLLMVAKEVIIEQGYNYNVTINIGNFSFPTKSYGDISFPAGYYDALKVEIGEAKGENWWCVMFPPLCFVDVSSGIVPTESKEILKENLSEEDYSLISNGNQEEDYNEITFKFKLIEMLQNVKIFTAKN